MLTPRLSLVVITLLGMSTAFDRHSLIYAPASSVILAVIIGFGSYKGLKLHPLCRSLRSCDLQQMEEKIIWIFVNRQSFTIRDQAVTRHLAWAKLYKSGSARLPD